MLAPTGATRLGRDYLWSAKSNHRYSKILSNTFYYCEQALAACIPLIAIYIFTCTAYAPAISASKTAIRADVTPSFGTLV